MEINALGLRYDELNSEVRDVDGRVTVENCLGQRFIGAGQSEKDIIIKGTPGNALGSYLDGANITVYGNAQDATGDTMNNGKIVIHGSTGDAAGYAMRGGQIFVRDNAGYRAGIHMKAYAGKLPVIVIGGRCGSFLGEYQAGGIIIVLGLNCSGKDVVGSFCGTGMHGGKIFIRCDVLPAGLPEQINVQEASEADMDEIGPYLAEYEKLFHRKIPSDRKMFKLTPNTNNPYKQLYVQN